MNPVSTATVRSPNATSTVLAWPPKRGSRSNRCTSCRSDSASAAPSPETPAPMTAIFTCRRSSFPPPLSGVVRVCRKIPSGGRAVLPGLEIGIGLERALPPPLEIHHRRRIRIRRRHPPGSRDRLEEGERVATGIVVQLRHPARAVASLGVELLPLRLGVEDPEERRGVGSGARRPLPSHRI